MRASRGLRRLLSATALVALSSCAERRPSQPTVQAPDVPPSYEAVSDSALLANQANWSASGVDAYRYRFRWECFCTLDYVRVVDITVVRGTIVSVTDVETGKPLDAQAVGKYRTIEGLFDLVRSAIAYPAESVDGAFDARLGYPSAMQVDYAAGLADDELGFRVYSLSSIPRWSSFGSP